MRKNVKQLKETSHKYAQEGLAQIDMRGYEYAFHQHTHITSVLKIGIAFSNRIVSSAYTTSIISRGQEQALSSPTIVFYDADESEYPKIDGVKKNAEAQSTVAAAASSTSQRSAQSFVNKGRSIKKRFVIESDGEDNKADIDEIKSEDEDSPAKHEQKKHIVSSMVTTSSIYTTQTRQAAASSYATTSSAVDRMTPDDLPQTSLKR